jgi:site-specific DNA recombinase
MRCAIYARYSSDLQNPRSISDQIEACRKRAQQEGWTLTAEYSDAAISGSSTENRPGLKALEAAATAGNFAIILCESLDRLSRNLGDLAYLHERLTFSGIRIVTLTDGEVGKLHAGFRGMFADLFLDDLKAKTRRGLVGCLTAGRSTGGRTYGYRADPTTRVLQVVPDEAALVRRIFREYVDGRSPRAIVAALNREGICGPRGGAWSASTLNGSRARANGILCNRLYVGEAVYGRQRNVKEPKTGRHLKRLIPRSEWIVKEMPALAIVDRDLFDAAQRRRAASSQVRLTHRRRPRHVLSGLVVCGHCNGTMAVAREDRLACSTRTNKALCDNNRTIALSEVERRVLGALHTRLLAPEAVALAVETYRQQRAENAAVRQKAARHHARELDDINRKISRIVAAIENGDGEVSPLVRRLKDLEAEREAIIAAAPKVLDDDVLALHPRAAEAYRGKVETIMRALANGDQAAIEAVSLVRGLITRIIFTPGGKPSDLTIEGDLSVMLGHATNCGAVKVVPPSRCSRSSAGAAMPFRLAG